MTAFNVVRFRVKPGREHEFIAAHRNAAAEGFRGARRFALIKTGDNAYCVVGEWDSFDNIVDARPRMISLLDGFRDCLEDLGGGMGVTDPVSGDVIVESGAASKARRAAGARKAATKKRAPAAKRAESSAKGKARAKTSGRKPARKPARKTAAKRGRR